jgi:hypothetical protein
MAFVNQPVVKEALERLGQSGLPLTLVDGHVQCSGRYPSRDELAAGTPSRRSTIFPSIKVVAAAPTGHTLLLLDATGAYHHEIARPVGNRLMTEGSIRRFTQIYAD